LVSVINHVFGDDKVVEIPLSDSLVGKLGVCLPSDVGFGLNYLNCDIHVICQSVRIGGSDLNAGKLLDNYWCASEDLGDSVEIKFGFR
jgi:hypothetical protein